MTSDSRSVVLDLMTQKKRIEDKIKEYGAILTQVI